MSSLWSWILGWFLSAVTVIGNGLFIVLISKTRRLHTTANCFILSLGVADFCVGLSLVPFKFVCEFWPAGYCTVLLHFRWFFIYASVSNLCAMAAERYIAIVKPLRYNALMQRPRVVVFISAAWGAPTLIRLIGFSVAFSLDTGATLHYFLPIVLILFEFLPCIVLLLVTARMVLITRKISREMAALTSQLRFNYAAPTDVRAQAKSQLPTVRVIVFVVACFLLSYAASIFSTLCGIYLQHSCSSPHLWEVRRLCFIANSAANPIVYAFFKADVRKELKKLTQKRRKSPELRRISHQIAISTSI